MDIKKELLEKGCKAFSQIIEGFGHQYSKVLENRNISEANRVGKESLGKAIQYMDLNDEEITEKSVALYPEVAESILNWDKEKTMRTINEIKCYHQAAGFKAEGQSKETLNTIYNLMDEEYLSGA